MTGLYNWIRLRILAADSAWYRFRVRRAMKRRAKLAKERDPSHHWFIVVALMAHTMNLGALASCAARQARNTIAETQRDCERDYARATVAEVDAIHARCDGQYEDVRRGE